MSASEQNASAPAPPATPATRRDDTYSARWLDFGVGLFFVLLGCFVLWAGRDLPLQATNRPGPGLLPSILAGICILGGATLAVQQLVSPTDRRVKRVGGAAYQRVTAIFVVTTVTVILFEPLGFICATWLLMAGILFGVERKFTLVSVATVVLLPLVSWTLFAVLLGVRLPAGLVYF